jgi:hypothetical protein
LHHPEDKLSNDNGGIKEEYYHVGKVMASREVDQATIMAVVNEGKYVGCENTDKNFGNTSVDYNWLLRGHYDYRLVGIVERDRKGLLRGSSEFIQLPHLGGYCASYRASTYPLYWCGCARAASVLARICRDIRHHLLAR